MTDMLVISNLVLWALVAGLGVTVFALARQIGILHERVAPAGALMPMSGPRVGEATSVIEANAIDGSRVRIGGEDSEGFSTLIFFLSPTCPVCKSLIPAVKSLHNRERERLRLVFASDGDTPAAHLRYVADHGLDTWPYVVSTEIGMAFGASKLPFAALVDPEGVLKGKGLVNTREHLESLIDAMDLNVASLQDFMNLNSNDDRRARENA